MKKISVLFLCLVMLVTGCGNKSISTSTDKSTVPSRFDSSKQSKFVSELYKMRKTELTDSETIDRILNTIPFFLFQKCGHEANGNILKINYNIAIRSEYRNKNELKKMMKQIAL